MQAAIKGPLASKLAIDAFRKTDGLAQDAGGARLYTLEFAATLAFGDDMLVETDEHEIRTFPPAATLNDGKDFSWDAFQYRSGW